jgi:CheY-like chemotaxis protein
MMGGTIGLESEPGRGWRFTVEVPVELAHESEVSGAQASHQQLSILEPGQPEYRVLIVDDNPENSMVLERLLSRAGFQVKVARNGALGDEQFRQWRPHFIWMDLRMPEMNWMEATRRIRGLAGGQKVKIAAMSASAFKSERDAVMASGIDDFISKPYRWNEVFECMARHLGVRYRHEQAVETGSGEQAGLVRPAALAALPSQLRRDLADTVILLDRQQISSVIDRVREQDEALASALSRLADRSAYTLILNAIEKSERQGEHESSLGARPG